MGESLPGRPDYVEIAINRFSIFCRNVSHSVGTENVTFKNLDI